VTPEQVNWITHLARLELTEGELATMARQLTAILDYVNQLQTVDTEDITPLAHPIPVYNVFRGDEPLPSLAVEAALSNAPDRRGDYYAVPAVLQ
jgi:aspartyl-tRNA(Asn)/glutamyl-tRNA(Gln) amidotransferase subunit C